MFGEAISYDDVLPHTSIVSLTMNCWWSTSAPSGISYGGSIFVNVEVESAEGGPREGSRDDLVEVSEGCGGRNGECACYAGLVD